MDENQWLAERFEEHRGRQRPAAGASLSGSR